MKTTLQKPGNTKRLLQFLLCAFMSLLFPHTVATAENTEEPEGKNGTLFTLSFNEDGETDNIIAAKYDGKYYVMGKQRTDGKRYANEVIDAGKYGSFLNVDKSSAETFKVEGQRITLSNGSDWGQMFKTDNGYIVDKYRVEGSHGFTTASESDSQFNNNSFLWRWEWDFGLYNHDTYGRIFFVADGTDLYFDILPSSQNPDATHIRIERYSVGCQHPNMQHFAAVAPTCKTNGHDEYWYCPDCKAEGYSAYFSDAIGLNGSFDPPVIMSYGAIDSNHDGVCDDCGKNMPVFRKVTEAEKILVGGKYILITQVGDRYFAATTGTEKSGEILPAKEVSPSADGSFTFEGTKSAMMIDLQFAAGVTIWGDGIRYGLLTTFNNQPMTFNPYEDRFYFEEYRVEGSKYGFYVGLEADGTAKLHSAYSPDTPIRSYYHTDGQIFTLKDFSSDAAYTESNVYLYRLTETGTVGTNTYDMTDVKSNTDYDKIVPEGSNAEKGTTVTGIADAMTQEAVNKIVDKFATENNITGSNITVNVSADITAVDYVSGESATFEVTPNATLSADGVTANYPISDDSFDGVSSMTITVYTSDVNAAEVIHEKEDGTKECFYQEWSDEVRNGGEEAFYQLYDNDGNQYVTFDVTEFSKIRILKTPLVTYTVSFDANGGEGTMAPVADVSGSYTLPECGFTAPAGKRFKGWALAADGEVIAETTIDITSDITLYAIWEDIPEYEITVTGGKATDSKNAEITKAAAGTTVTITADAAPDGMEFDKWVVESGEITLADDKNSITTFVMPETAVSIKAVYKTASGIQNVSNDETAFKVFDLKGRLLFNSATRNDLQTLPSGVYIINGKKVIR